MSDGATRRDHYESYQRQSGRVHPDLADLRELPPLAISAWNWFLQLNQARTSNGYGPNPITYTEIYSFFCLEGEFPEPWEIRLIRAFDVVAIKNASKSAKAAQEQAKSKTKSTPKKR